MTTRRKDKTALHAQAFATVLEEQPVNLRPAPWPTKKKKSRRTMQRMRKFMDARRMARRTLRQDRALVLGLCRRAVDREKKSLPLTFNKRALAELRRAVIEMMKAEEVRREQRREDAARRRERAKAHTSKT